MILPDLAAIARTAPDEELPALAGRLREAELIAEVRLRAGAPAPPTAAAVAAPTILITPARAAEIATLPPGARSINRVYGWAKGKRWASNPTGRCLLIDEALFRRWLTTRKV